MAVVGRNKLVDIVVESGKIHVSKHQVQPEWGACAG